MSTVLPLEQVTRTVAAGFRFVDTATRARVSNGLAVSLRVGSRRLDLASNRSDVFVVPKVFGHDDLSWGAGDRDWWTAHEDEIADLELSVIDSMRRFLSYRTPVAVPHRGLWAAPCLASSPIGDVVRALPLFSAPGRQLPADVASVRVRLVHKDNAITRPTRNALVSLSLADQAPESPLENRRDLGLASAAAHGITDRTGDVLVAFPWPEAPPPSDPPTPLHASKWRLNVAVRSDQNIANDAGVDDSFDLCAVVRQQDAALTDAHDTPVTEAELSYARGLELAPSHPYQLFVTV